jgi:hypothetical protein
MSAIRVIAAARIALKPATFIKYSEVLPGLTAGGRSGWLLMHLPGRTP